MTSETVAALERIQGQITRLRNLQAQLSAMRSEGLICPNTYTFEVARTERAIESVSSLYNLLLMEHRIFAKSRECLVNSDQVQLSLF